MRIYKGVTTAAGLLFGAALLSAALPAANSAPAAACVIDPQLNQVTINQGLPYPRLVRGKETLVRLYVSLPASLPKCAKSGAIVVGSIKVNSATLTVKNGGTVLASGVGARVEAIGAEITNTAPTTQNPSMPANAPAHPKFVVAGSVLAPAGVTASFTAAFEGTIKYQSKGADGVFTSERTKIFTSFTPPGGTSTPISKPVEKQTKTLRLLVVPMGGALSDAARSAVANGMTQLARMYPVPDGTVPNGTGARTGALTSSLGALRYTIDAGTVDMTGLLDPDGRFCGTSTNFAGIQAQLIAFRNAWNGVVNGVDSPQDQDADKVIGVISESASVPSGTGDPRGCLEGYAMTNSNESWIRAVPSMTGPLFGMEVCHTFGCVADTGTYHSLNTNADTQDPDRAYDVPNARLISDDRTVMKLILPWTNENTVMEKDHFGYLLCGFGGTNTNGCPAAPATGTLTGVAAGPTFVMYGTTDNTAAGTTVNSMYSLGAPATVPDPSSPYKLFQMNAAGGTIGTPQGVPVRKDISAHGHDTETAPNNLGSFNVAFAAETGTKRIELLGPGGVVLYSRDENDNAPAITSATAGSAGGGIGYRPRPSGSARILAVLDVTTTANSGAGSLRDAIVASNASVGVTDTITFSIGTGPQTISPTSALPTITDPVTIDGTTQEGFAGTPLIELNGFGAGSAHGFNVTAGSTTIKGFVINDFVLDGIHLETGGGNTVVGNWIGTDVSGQETDPNLGDGIQMQGSDGNQIGGTTTAERNVVSASGGHGIFMLESDGNVVEGNYVGTDVDGVEDFGNGIDGIAVDGGSNNDIGPGNVSSGNTNQGVAIFTVGSVLQSSGNTILENTFGLGSAGAPLPNGGQGVLIASGVGNSISQNSISANGVLGIDLALPNGINTNDPGDGDTGSNNLQNFPTLSSAGGGASTSVSGSLDSAAGTYSVEFFANAGCDGTNGEGARFLGATDVVLPGGSPFSATGLGPTFAGEVVTATATDSAGNTSEFSVCRSVIIVTGDAPQGGPTFTVNTSSDGSPSTSGCTTAECTLREAIDASNAQSGANTIQFNIAGAGPHTISLTSSLPSISGSSVHLDGNTQPTGTITVDGAALSEADGLFLASGSGGSTIEGLEIVDYLSGAAIRIASGNNTIVGNELFSVLHGIVIESGASNTIGGSHDAGEGNRIWNFNGNGIQVYSAGSGNQIAGNTIGLSDDGVPTAGGMGIHVDNTAGTVIGSNATPDSLGLDFDLGNVVVKATGEGVPGIVISSTVESDMMNTIVAGNFIGVNRTGTATNLGNLGAGIVVAGTNDNQIGPANAIAYNGGPGIDVSDGTENRIVANSIHDNGGKGIRLSNANGGLFAPELFSASPSEGTTTVEGEINGAPFGDYFVEFFSNASCDAEPEPGGFGEGETYLDFAVVNVDNEFESFSKSLSGLAIGDVVTATLTDAAVANGDTSEFSNCVTVEEAAPEGETPVTIRGTADVPSDTRTFVFVNCPDGRPHPYLVDLRPTSTTGTTYTTRFNFDPDEACGGIQTSAFSTAGSAALADEEVTLRIVTTDGFQTSPEAMITLPSPNKPPAPEISTASTFFSEWDEITLYGSAFDEEEIGGGDLVWTAGTPALFSGTKTGLNVKLVPPSTTGWTPGMYPVTLTATDSEGLVGSVTKTIKIRCDADHDGWNCDGPGGDFNDNDKYDAYKDCDNDGQYNADDGDVVPCTPDASVSSTADFQPDPLVLPYTGNVTMTVQLSNRNPADVLASSVRLTNIDGQNVSTDNNFKATSVLVTNTGFLRATFNGTYLSSWLVARHGGVYNRRILITIGGSSKPTPTPTWTFTGTDSTYVKTS